MPNKKTFDLVLITALLLHPAIGLVRMSARRWSREGNGALAKTGDTIQIGLGS